VAAPYQGKATTWQLEFVRIDTTDETHRQIELACIQARELAAIKAELGDIAVLQQQTVDLLRRILARQAVPTWNGVFRS